MVKNKLDYLSKYTEKPLSKKGRKEKKRIKEKISDWKDEKLNDDDDAFMPPTPKDDDDDEEDERPIIVPSDELPEAAISSRNYSLPTQEYQQTSWNNVSDINVRRGGRQRHDSSDDESGDDGRPKPQILIKSDSDHQRRRRHDSSDEDGDKLQQNDSPSGIWRSKRRHDSFDDEHDDQNSEKGGNIKDNITARAEIRKQRNDSSDGNFHDIRQSMIRGLDRDTSATKTFDSNNAGKSSRKRHDSSDDDCEDNNHRSGKRVRHDSSDDDSKSSDRTKDKGHDEQKRQADDVKSREKVQVEAASTAQERDSGRKLMSSGHAGGLQRGREFSDAEKKIQTKRREEALAMVDKYGVGETVYRDADGRKVDAEELKKTKETLKISEEEQRKLNRGRVQKEQDEAKKREFEELQHSSFARHVDDAALDDMQKNAVREGDPMAQQVLSNKRGSQQPAAGQHQNVRPVYKGPAPKPNRYGIRPGYRWDGVDRGNGFEDKLLASQFSAQLKREEAYKWSTADM
jgi:pre-mRNA-splicing factor CWC26